MVEGAGHNAGMEDYILLDDTDHIDVSQASDELDEVQAVLIMSLPTMILPRYFTHPCYLVLHVLSNSIALLC